MWDSSQIIHISGLSSSDPDGQLLTYTWNEISGYLQDVDITTEESDGSVISFTRPDFNGTKRRSSFYAIGYDGEDISTIDTLTVKFGKPSKPLSPILSTGQIIRKRP